MKMKLLASLLAALCLNGCNDSGSTAVDSEPKTSWQQDLKNVQELIVGREGERDSAIYKAFFARIHSDAKTYMDTIVFNQEKMLWPDYPQSGSEDYSNEMHFFAQRLNVMSQAYITPGPLYLNPELWQKINQGLDAFLTRIYLSGNDGGKQVGGWYEWQIGVPQELMSLVANLDGYLGETLKRRITDSVDTYLQSIDNINGYPAPGYSTGSNRVDQAWAMMVRGFVKQDKDDIVRAKKAFIDSQYNRYSSYKNVASGSPGAFRFGTIDSFRKDGSYIFHGDIPYSNGYGLDLLNRSAEMLILLHGTEFDFSATEKDTILNDAFDRLFTSYLPWLKDGIGMDATAGRAVFRGFEQNHGKGQWAIEGVLKFYQLADYGSDPIENAKRKQRVGRFVKAFLNNDFNFYSKYGADSSAVQPHDIEHYASRAISIKLAKDIMADASVPYVKEPLPGTMIFPEMDRMVHRTPTFSFALASHSYRTGNYEIVGGEGSRACFSADGMTYIYDDDLDQYMNYWVAFDADRPAGVTNDGISPHNQEECGWSSQTGRARKDTLRWSGGVSAGSEGFGIFGMGYKDWNGVRRSQTEHESLPHVEAKKSWFMFGDTILAMGSDIKCNAGCDWSNVETTLDNRKLRADGENQILVNGSVWQGQPSVDSVSAMHIDGNVATSQLGIVFPQPGPVDLLRENRSGDWMLLASRAAKMMDRTLVEGTFLRTSVAHSAEKDSYAYVLLPGKTAVETDNYAAHPTLAVLGNNADYHAVLDNVRNVYAMNVFAEPSAEYVTASANIIKPAFTGNDNVNVPLNSGMAAQLLSLAESETFYGDNHYVKSTGGVSLMSRLVGDELTVWISQPTRKVMSAVIDISESGYQIAGLLEGGENAALSADGHRAVVKFDLLLVGQSGSGVVDFDAEGATYKLRFKVNPQ